MLEKVPRPQVLLQGDDNVKVIMEAHIPRVKYFEDALLWHFPTYIGHLSSTAEVLRAVVEWNRYKYNIKNHKKAKKRKTAMLDNNWLITNSQKEKTKEQITNDDRLREQIEANTQERVPIQKPTNSAWTGEEPARLPQQTAMNLESNQQLKEDLKSLDNAIIYCPSIVQRTKDAKGQVQLIEVWSQIITQKRFQDQNWQQIRMEALENETRVLTKHISLLKWVNLQPGTQNRGQGSPNSA